MSKKYQWLLIVPAILVSATAAHADSLDYRVNKDLYTAQLSAPKDLEQEELEKEGVEQAPASLTAEQKSQLKTFADILWNRTWYANHPSALDHAGSIETQKDKDLLKMHLLPEAVTNYNKAIENIEVEQKQGAQKAELIKQTPKEKSSHCEITEASAIPTENLKNLVLATNAAAQEAAQTEQSADATKAQAEHVDLVPADVKSEPLSSAPEKVTVPDGGFLLSMAQDPANPQTVYGLDLLPHNVNVTQGSAIIQKFAYDFVRSDDGGKTWNVVHKLLTSSGSILDGHIAVSTGASNIFITTNDGVIQTQDGGKSFSKLSGSLGNPVDVKLSSDGTRLAVSYDNGQGLQTFDHQNGSWVKSQSQPADLVKWVNRQFVADPRCQDDASGPNTCPYDTGANLKVFSVQMDPHQPGVLYAGLGQGEYKYQNGTWSLVQGLEDDSTVNNIEIGANGAMLVSTCNGIYTGQTSSNQVAKRTSANFINQDTGASSPSYLRSYQVTVNPQNPQEVASVSASGVYISKDGGTTWAREDLGASSGRSALSAANEFRSAVWSDGFVDVSSMNGTYRFTP
jgi:photosystem II stability/assembly factor-like uncharacterized protein